MKLLALCLAISLGSAINASERKISFPVKVNKEGFLNGIWDTGACRVSGQPTVAAFRELANEGVTTVINLRSQHEMDDRKDVPFDEEALLKELHINYVHIPLGEASDYTPDAVRRFAEALDKAQGKVLLHCTVAWRASYMWASYLYLNRHYSLTEAIRHGDGINFSADRVGMLLGAVTTYTATPRKTGGRTPRTLSGTVSHLHLEAPIAIYPPTKGNYMAFTVWQMGDVFNASQPNAKQLKMFADKGVKTVINIRAPQEMAAVNKNGFDEETVVKSLGMTYVSVPIQTLAQYTPANLALIADAIAQSTGKVLLHCTSANRTSGIWVAYLVKYCGLSLDDAMKHGEAMRYANILNDLIGMDISYKVKTST